MEVERDRERQRQRQRQRETDRGREREREREERDRDRDREKIMKIIFRVFNRRLDVTSNVEGIGFLFWFSYKVLYFDHFRKLRMNLSHLRFTENKRSVIN